MEKLSIGAWPASGGRPPSVSAYPLFYHCCGTFLPTLCLGLVRTDGESRPGTHLVPVPKTDSAGGDHQSNHPLGEPTFECLEDLAAEPHHPVSHRLLQLTVFGQVWKDHLHQSPFVNLPSGSLIHSWSQSFIASLQYLYLLSSCCSLYANSVLSFYTHRFIQSS